MAMTLRLTDEQERALAMLAETVSTWMPRGTTHTNS